MARPRKAIDPAQVEELAAIHCTLDEIAATLGCERTTLWRRFATAIEKGKQRGKMSLRRTQWKLAEGGNVTMAIWLGKQLLGQRDHHDVKIELTPEAARAEIARALGVAQEDLPGATVH